MHEILTASSDMVTLTNAFKMEAFVEWSYLSLILRSSIINSDDRKTGTSTNRYFTGDRFFFVEGPIIPALPTQLTMYGDKCQVWHPSQSSDNTNAVSEQPPDIPHVEPLHVPPHKVINNQMNVTI